MIEKIAFVVALTTNLVIAVILAFVLAMLLHPVHDPYPTPAKRLYTPDDLYTPKGPTCDSSGCFEIR